MNLFTRNIFLFLFIVSIFAGACAGRKNKTERRDIIPEKDLVPILSDIYLADGLLTIPRINYQYSVNDSISAYNEIIGKFGYTKAQMDRTIRFYCIKRPKRLIRIIDIVLSKLSEMDIRIASEMPIHRVDEINLWYGKSFYSSPDPSVKENTLPDFPVEHYNLYNLKFTLTLYPDDQSVNPHLGIFLYNPDTLGYAGREYFRTLPFIKDGRPHTYKSLLILKRTINPVSVGGWFIDRENQAAYLGEHLRVENIKLTRSPSD